MQSLIDCPDFNFLQHYGLQVNHEPVLELAFQGVWVIKVDLAAAATLILRTYIGSFEERAAATAAGRIVLVVINFFAAVISIVKAWVKARVVGDGYVIWRAAVVKVG